MLKLLNEVPNFLSVPFVRVSLRVPLCFYLRMAGLEVFRGLVGVVGVVVVVVVGFLVRTVLKNHVETCIGNQATTCLENLDSTNSILFRLVYNIAFH